MTAQNDPTWMARLRRHGAARVEFNPNSAAEHDAPNAPRAIRPRARVRLVVDGSRRYAAYDAHHLLEADSAGMLARPGHPFG
jgi:hypothetical protein